MALPSLRPTRGELATCVYSGDAAAQCPGGHPTQGLSDGSCDAPSGNPFRGTWGGEIFRMRSGLGWSRTCRRITGGAGAGSVTVE